MSDIAQKAVLLPRLVWFLIIVLTLGGGIVYSWVWVFAGIAVLVAFCFYSLSAARWPAYSGRLRRITRLLILTLLASALAIHYHREFPLADLWKLPAANRDEALTNWKQVEKAFNTENNRTLERLIGSKVLILIDASGSPWTGRSLSMEERALAAGDAARLSGALGEHASQIATEIRERRDRSWQVDCRISFTRKQVRRHFTWPDAVFTADFELLGTLTQGSISGHSIRIQPIAIQPLIVQL